MNIVTIHNSHNATVSYFRNGYCDKVLHEEKFSNKKNHAGFPALSLEYLSQQYDFANVDFFVIPHEEILSFSAPRKQESHGEELPDDLVERLSQGWLRALYDYIEHFGLLRNVFYRIRRFLWFDYVSPKAKSAVAEYLRDKYGIPGEKIRYLDHHTCHALTPFYFYGLDKIEEDVLLLTMDGAGGDSFSKLFVWRSKDRSLSMISDSRYDASLGLLYSLVTEYLGMRRGEHEYKVMGLAAYVSDEKYYRRILERLRRIVWLDEETLTFHSRVNTALPARYFVKLFRCERFDNMSAAMQQLIEELVVRWIRCAVRKTGIGTIATSGGVFMNVKMNQKIQELPEVEKAYFMPSCGDESLGIGAACSIYLNRGVRLDDDGSMYKGHSYTNQDVEAFVAKTYIRAKYNVSFHNDIDMKVAELLSGLKIVARIRGACEWGARSLCNRAILGNASDLRTFYEVNDAIKMRDFWMPFAPVILEEWADRYLKDWDVLKDKVSESSRYMITTFDSTELGREHLRAAIHQKDKTLRPQVLNEKMNASMYRLLKQYERITGMGGMLNTSFNMHGYPMVGTLEQAMFTFENSGLRYLAVENYLVEKLA